MRGSANKLQSSKNGFRQTADRDLITANGKQLSADCSPLPTPDDHSRRRTRADQSRFFQIAFGSLRESQAILDLAMDEGRAAAEKADVLAAHIYRLIKCCRGG